MDPNNNPSRQSNPYFALNNFPYHGFSANVNFGTSEISSSNSHQSHASSQIPSSSSHQSHASYQESYASQIPDFSSQHTTHFPSFSPQHPEAPTQSPNTQPEAAVDRRQRRQWNDADDLVLVSAWLNTSKDCIVGNDQRAGTFWQRITDYYESSDHVLIHGGEHRTISNCKQRWDRIKRDTSHFCGKYAQAVDEHASGTNDVDTIKKAHESYYTVYKTKYTLEHCWRVLRNEQKWENCAAMNPTSNTSSKKRKGPDQAEPSVTSVVGEEEVRPPGIKAMKAKKYKGKAKGGKSAEYQQMWENREKDNEVKERLQRMSLLDTLLAKTQPLDEDEKILRKTLMADLIKKA